MLLFNYPRYFEDDRYYGCSELKVSLAKMLAFTLLKPVKKKIREDNLVSPTKVSRKRNSLVNRIGEISMARIKPDSYKPK